MANETSGLKNLLAIGLTSLVKQPEARRFAATGPN